MGGREPIREDVVSEDRDRLGDPPDCPVLRHERDVRPADVHGATDAQNRIPGPERLADVHARAAEQRERVETEIGLDLVELHFRERVRPLGVERREGRERGPVRPDRAGEEVLRCGERLRGVIEHLLVGWQRSLGQLQGRSRTERPLAERIGPQLKPAVEDHAVPLEGPVAVVVRLDVGLVGGHRVCDRRVVVEDAELRELLIELGLPIRVHRPGMGVVETADRTQRHVPGSGHDRAEEQIAGIRPDEPLAGKVLDEDIFGGGRVETKWLGRARVERRRVRLQGRVGRADASLQRHELDPAGRDREIHGPRGIGRGCPNVAACRQCDGAAGKRSDTVERDRLRGGVAIDHQVHVARPGAGGKR